MSSADTDHSFWVPRLAGKMDLIPNKVNTMWIDPQAKGLYLGQCAQYCGVQHAKMLIRVYADTPEEFAAWLDHQRQPAVDDPAVAEAATYLCTMHASVAIQSEAQSLQADLVPISPMWKPRNDCFGVSPQHSSESSSIYRQSCDLKPGALMPPMHLDSPRSGCCHGLPNHAQVVG